MIKNNRIIFLLIFAFFLEVLLKSSGINFLASLEPLIIICLVYQEKRERNNFIFILFIIFSLLLEIINFNFIGLRALSFSLIYLIVNLLTGVFKILKRNINFKVLLVLIMQLLVIQIFSGLYRAGFVTLDLAGIIANFFLYIIVNSFFNKLIPNKYII